MTPAEAIAAIPDLDAKAREALRAEALRAVAGPVPAQAAAGRAILDALDAAAGPPLGDNPTVTKMA